jgi:2-hydroxy-3-keto-5-methylthiopentenyl-1-phosphate phosphatase
MLIISDFDGTVTARDTNSTLARRFAPAAQERVEGKLATRELTIRDVLGAEYEAMTAGLDAIVEAALEIPFRAGFGEFVDAVEGAGARLVLLSGGFTQVIEPMLADKGFLGRVPLVANDIEFDESGGRVTWRELPVCDLCGEECKRHDVATLRAQHAQFNDTVVFIGDGFSDRCGAETADIVFARDNLAAYLDERELPYRPWDDFFDIAHSLDLESFAARTRS